MGPEDIRVLGLEVFDHRWNAVRISFAKIKNKK